MRILSKMMLRQKELVASRLHQSNILGTINDVELIGHHAARANSLFVVDACQSIPHMPVDVRSLGADLVAWSGHKMLGPNGIGKTTLLYMALGWLQPSAGRVLLENRLLRDYSRAELGRRVSLVPQIERQPYSYTVLEYVLFGRAPHLALFGARPKRTYSRTV